METRRHLVARMVLAVAFMASSAAQAGISFTAADPFPISLRPQGLVTADLDGDENDDAVTLGAEEGIGVLAGSAMAAARFSSATVIELGGRLHGPTVADLNGDGFADIVVTDSGEASTGIWLLLNRGDGSFDPPRFTMVGVQPVAVATADFDGVRGNDVVVADRQLDGVLVGLNDGENPPGFEFLPLLAVGQGPDEILTADLDGDGDADVATLNRGAAAAAEVGVLILAGATSGLPAFEPVRQFGVGEDPFAMLAGDFNDDGGDDLALLNSREGDTDQIQILLSKNEDILAPPVGLDLKCPFFTGGRACRARALATADFNGDDRLDLAVALTDPRSFVDTDALQIFAGNGTGGFIAGPVFPIGKEPAAVAKADMADDPLVDVIVAAERLPSVQAFINVSTPGALGNGAFCLAAEECLSGRCTNGICCATQCFDFERCDVPTQEGLCVRVETPVACASDVDCEGFGHCATDSGRSCAGNEDCDGDLCLLEACRQGFCCEMSCSALEQRCDVAGFEGVCLDRGEGGEECTEDADCRSGFCRGGFCCNQECESGTCGVPAQEGQCLPLLPDGAFCEDDDGACMSGVCDDFDAVCCNRICFDNEFCNAEGRCERFQLPTPTGVPTGTATATIPGGATATPTATSASNATPTATSVGVVCPGDCDGSGEVLVHELIDGVTLLLDRPSLACAAADVDANGSVTVDEVVAAIQAALRGCASTAFTGRVDRMQ